MTGCGLGNRLLTMSTELDRNPNTRFYWMPIESTSGRNASMVQMRFEDLFEVAGESLPFVPSLPGTPLGTKWIHVGKDAPIGGRKHSPSRQRA